ncbi:MAG: O-methyltransferase [Clostridia bacterium]|nr:O-methyltransferase [Clostridia bacterium]
MIGFKYAHGDTSGGERKTPTAQFNGVKLNEKIARMREEAFAREIPTADDETLNFICTLLAANKPENILELGTATGISGAVMLDVCKDAHLTTIEREQSFYNEAVKNFKCLGIDMRVSALFGDAYECLQTLQGTYDFIFLDCAKVQYVKLLPKLKNLLKKGGVLLADDVLLYGWITGEAEVPKKRKMLYTHVKEYVDAAVCDSELYTTILNVGDGLAMSVKK